MIHYQVRCTRDHEFDGWFKDSASFDKLAKRGLVECPTCGDTKVERALMTPAVSKRETAAERHEAVPPPQPQPATPSAPAPAPAPTSVASGPMPDQVRAALQRIRSEIEKNCAYVGPNFAEEARKMHRGESDVRGIYGEASPEQAESLQDEGIEFSRVPWVPRADA